MWIFLWTKEAISMGEKTRKLGKEKGQKLWRKSAAEFESRLTYERLLRSTVLLTIFVTGLFLAILVHPNVCLSQMT